MAIGPLSSPPRPADPAPGGGVDIDAWTEQQAAEAIANVSITDDVVPTPAVQPVRRTAVTLEIPLDELNNRRERAAAAAAKDGYESSGTAKTTTYKRKEPLRRDSMKRREALLKGKEGSRQRRRWENDRLLNNPWAAPPLPSDWEVRPTYNVQHVPYYLAPLWDAGIASHYAERRKKAQQNVKQANPEAQARAEVPKDLKEKLKKSKAAKALLQDLEKELRHFLAKWEDKSARMAQEEELYEPDSSDDEIVFVGRNGTMHDRPTPPQTSNEKNLEKEMCLFKTPAGDKSAAFGRWLVHHLGQYYGLRTWSVTVGKPARREAYVGIRMRTGRPVMPAEQMPRPLWGLV